MKVISYCIFLLVSTWAHAQTRPVSQIIDSLKQEALAAVDLPAKFKATIPIAVRYTYANPDSAIKFGELALALAEEMDDINNEIWALAVIGEAYIYKANLPKTIELALRAIERSSTLSSEDLSIGPTYYNLSATYYEIQDYDNALLYAKKMIDLGGDPLGIDELAGAFGYYLIAMVYERLGLPDSSLTYLARSLPLFETAGKGKYDLGSAWMDRVWPGLYNTRAKAYLQKGQYDKALKDLFWVLSTTERNYEYFHSANTYNDIALYYRELGSSDSAIYYAEKGLEEANVIAYTQAQLAASKILSGEYESKDPVEALRYYKLANEFQNSLFGAGNVKIIREMIEQDERRRQELADAEVAFQNRLRTNIFLGSSFTLLVIIALLFWSRRLQRKSKRSTEIAYEKLKNTQAQLIHSEKMASLGELTAGIAHEIQNPLNFVNNFSEVSNEMLDEMHEELSKGDVEEAKAIANNVKQNLGKILHHGKRADDIVKGMLQHSRISTGQKEPTDINALCDEYLRLSYHGLRAKDKSFNADYKTDLDPSLPKVNLIPQDIGRVMLNLINNSFYAVYKKAKEGYKDYKPLVTVSTKVIPLTGDLSRFGRARDGLKEIQITVKDNGPGVPEQVRDKIFQPFFTTKPTGQGTGLGLSLSYDIIKAHGGKLTFENDKNEGTVFIISLPVNT
jgi:two-component system, NtrC family, sensor kinase